MQQAFVTLNRLPSATLLDVNRYPRNVIGSNQGAYYANIIDLKLVTLHTVLEEMGLSSPLRYVWTLHYMDDAFLNNLFFYDEASMSPEQIAFYLRKLNFDPVTFQPTPWLSGQRYTFQIDILGIHGPSFAQSVPIDPSIGVIPPVADANVFNRGLFATGLSRDDVGGLKYLLQYNNVNVETFDPSVHVRLANRRPVARTGRHLGVDKITFVKHRSNGVGAFLPMTFRSAVYVLDGHHVETALANRFVTKPDFLFSAGHLSRPWVERSGTSNWVNNSAANHKADGEGPGVIAGQTQITFDTNTSPVTLPRYQWHWGNITSATNAVILGR